MSPREIFEQQYKTAAGEGAIYELRMRLLADKVPELQQSAYGKKFEEVETLVVDHFASALGEQEKDTLKLCRQLRNKIVHSDFRATRNKLKELGAETQRGGVKKVDIKGLSGAQIAGKIASVEADVPGTFEYVADSLAGAGRVLGWLLEAGQAGDFSQAAGAFARGAAIVDRLAFIGIHN